MIDVRVVLVQLCRQALSLFLLEESRPGSDLSTDGGLPIDSVRFHNTIRAFQSTACAMRRMLIAIRSRDAAWKGLWNRSNMITPGAPPLTTYGQKLIKRGKDRGESVQAF